MAEDPNLPSVKRAAALGWMVQQPPEIQEVAIRNLSFREQVHTAAECADTHKNWTVLLLVNQINAERLYTPFTGSYQSIAISDVIFSQPGFQHELMSGILDDRTAEELKDVATHTRDWNMGVDRPSDFAKQALGLPLANREAWPLLLAGVQDNEMAFLQYSELRRDEDQARCLASSRPQCLLKVLIDLVGVRKDFTVGPYSNLCSCCLLSKYATPTALSTWPSGGKICEQCQGPELERQFIPLAKFLRFMENDEFDQRGLIRGYERLCYSNRTATGKGAQKYTWILREHANVVTQKRFGQNFDDVMYLLDNGREP